MGTLPKPVVFPRTIENLNLLLLFTQTKLKLTEALDRAQRNHIYNFVFFSAENVVFKNIIKVVRRSVEKSPRKFLTSPSVGAFSVAEKWD